MAIKMLNPKVDEYIIDPACGSGGFLLHTMYWIWDKYLVEALKKGRTDYANQYLFGFDFDDNMRRISQALMLIAGDGKHHIFKRDGLDARDWRTEQADEARVAIKRNNLLAEFKNPAEDEENKKTFRYLNFDVLLTNPPFAGEITDSGLLRQYEFAKKKGKLKLRMERHLLFIERSLDTLKPGGRLAIVLPQGVLNNTNMEWVRKWLFEKARILAVVGLHQNTFKLPAPAKGAGTKTSVLFLQKWNKNEKLSKDYPIFMAVSKKSGKDNSGEYIFIDEKGNRVHSKKGFFPAAQQYSLIISGFDQMPLNSKSFESNVAVYPNPAEDKLFINSAKNAILGYEIVDTQGRIVKKEKLNSLSDFSINIATLNSGMYLVVLQSEVGTSTHKIVKK